MFNPWNLIGITVVAMATIIGVSYTVKSQYEEKTKDTLVEFRRDHPEAFVSEMRRVNVLK